MGLELLTLHMVVVVWDTIHNINNAFNSKSSISIALNNWNTIKKLVFRFVISLHGVFAIHLDDECENC